MIFLEGWILAIGVGLVFLGLFRFFAWSQVRKSAVLRSLICAVLSLCLAPTIIMPFGVGDLFGGIAVFPATLSIAWLLFEGQANAPLYVVSIASLLVTFSLMMHFWSRAPRKWR